MNTYTSVELRKLPAKDWVKSSPFLVCSGLFDAVTPMFMFTTTEPLSLGEVVDMTSSKVKHIGYRKIKAILANGNTIRVYDKPYRRSKETVTLGYIKKAE